MVRLYGVMHGSQVQDILGRVTPIYNTPHPQLLKELVSLPKDSVVGIEDMPTEDWTEVEQDLDTKAINEWLLNAPKYFTNHLSYWQPIVQCCQGASLEVVYLETKELWFTISDALLDQARLTERASESTDERTYYREMCRKNDALFVAESKFRKIHELDRDKALLETVAQKSLDAVIVGIGHSEHWMANPDHVARKYDVRIDSYMTDTPQVTPNGSFTNGETVFSTDPKPNLQMAFDREGLERTLNFISTGRLTDRIADYVGLWDLHSPLKGYFELFITKRDGEFFEGVIQDNLGEADVIGAVIDADFDFDKTYRLSTGQLAPHTITYTGKRRDSAICGTYDMESQNGSFFMLPFQDIKPLDLAMKWYDKK